MIDGAFVEQLIAQGCGYRTLQRSLNHRFRDEWQDAMQESLLALWRNRSNLRRAESARDYFIGVVRRTALSYRGRQMDRASYCEIEPRHAVWLPDAIDREQEIEQAQERFAQLLRKLPAYERELYRAWRKRGYRVTGQTESGHLTRLVKALAHAAEMPYRPGKKGAYCASRSRSR